MQRTLRAALAATLLGGTAVIASNATASAQSAAERAAATELSSRQRVRPARTRPRIVVTPTARVYRHCVDWYAVERRATGDTVVPNMRCWWAYR